MDIGKEGRPIVVEPIEEPATAPVVEPSPQKVEPVPEQEPVGVPG